MFLSRLMPGLGHVYIGKWGHAVGTIIVLIFLFVTPHKTKPMYYAMLAAIWALWVIAIYKSAAGACKGAGGPPRPVKLLAGAVAAKEPVLVALALLAKLWAVEAFYVPTGAMAPTILGEHAEVMCEACGLAGRVDARGLAECTNCGTALPLKGPRQMSEGDRIVAIKLLNLVELRPWDVIVFRNPQNLRENYVKRLIGLPGESIEIILGDVFCRSDENAPWRIRRKPPSVQESVWQLLCDQDYLPRDGSLRGRWRTEGDWKEAEDRRSFRLPDGAKESLLSFDADRKLFFPCSSQFGAGFDETADVCGDLRLTVEWTPPQQGQIRLRLGRMGMEFQAELSTDGTAILSSRRADGSWQEWAKAQTGTATGRAVRLALAHADYRLTFFVDGQPVLASEDGQYSPDVEKLRALSLSAGIAASRHWHSQLSPGQARHWLARYDPALVLQYVQAGLSPQERETLSKSPQAVRDWLSSMSEAELERVLQSGGPTAVATIPQPSLAIEGTGGGAVRHLQVHRDIYYTCPELMGNRYDQEDSGKYASRLGVAYGMPGWGTTGNPMRLARDPQRSEFDEFFVLGDNSAASLDGRLWTRADPSLKLYDQQGRAIYTLGTVPRYCLIGKATKRYWPPERIGPLP